MTVIITIEQRPWILIIGVRYLKRLVLKPGYSGRIKPMPRLLIPWLLASTSYQQIWGWLCRLEGSLLSIGEVFKYHCHISVSRHIEIINTLCFLWNIQRFEDGTMWMNLILFSHQPVLSTMFALHIMPKGLASFKLMQLKYANGLI